MVWTSLKGHLAGITSQSPVVQLIHEVVELARIYGPWVVLGRVAKKAVETVAVERAKRHFGSKPSNMRKRTVLLYGPDGKVEKEIDVDGVVAGPFSDQ